MNLLVAFKGSGNSANRLVSALQGEKLFLTNSFAGLQEDIARMDGSFDVVYMFGLDKTLRGSIRVEACACLDEELVFSALDYTKLALAFQVQGLRRLSAQSRSYLYVMQPIGTCCKNTIGALFSATFRPSSISPMRSFRPWRVPLIRCEFATQIEQQTKRPVRRLV